MRAKDVKSRIGSHGLFGVLFDGHLSSPKTVKTVVCQVAEEMNVDRVRASVASNLWHVTFG